MDRFLPILLAALLLLPSCDDKNTPDPQPDPDPIENPKEDPAEDPSEDPSEDPVVEISDFIEPDDSGMNSDVFALARRMDVGFNIGNTLECPGGENAWGNPNITPELLLAVKEAGFGAVRLPVAWDLHATDGVIDPAWLARVREVVDYAMAADLVAIINCHWDGGWIENHIADGYSEAIDTKLAGYWKQISLTFRDYDERLVFAGLNEPNAETAAQMKTLARYEQTFVDAVRATGGRNHYRVLAIQGPYTDVDKTETLFGAMPADVEPGRLMAEVHYYSPYQFCLMEEDAGWGKCYYFWGDANKSAASRLGMSDRWSSWGGDSYLKTQMAKMKRKFVDKGVPVILGEYGALMERVKELAGNDAALELNRKSIADFHEAVAREGKKAGIVTFLWDTGAAIDRRTCGLKSETLIPAVIRGARSTAFPF